jgi:hypothetical protein
MGMRMKFNVKVLDGDEVAISPGKVGECVFMDVLLDCRQYSVVMTPEQAAAVICGLEAAIEVLEVRRLSLKASHA